MRVLARRIWPAQGKSRITTWEMGRNVVEAVKVVAGETEICLKVRIQTLGAGLPGSVFSRLCDDHRDSAIIFSRQVVPADAQHFLKHACPIHQWIDAGPAHCVPSARALPPRGTQICAPEKESPDRSPSARSRCSGRIVCAARRVKALKPHCVSLNCNPKIIAKQQVEDSAKKLPMQRLPLRLQFRAQPARSDSDVRPCRQSLQQLRHLFDRRR